MKDVERAERLLPHKVAAPRTTMILTEILALGVLAQAASAGGFLDGHHMWLTWPLRQLDLAGLDD